jgi:RNA polymerase sigma factor (TIGR02999 family)
MTDVTRILSAIEHGDAAAAAALLPIVYDELRRLAAGRLARESPGQTMQATALVHEAYLRLVGDPAKQWDGRGHFFAAAAEAMRRILIDRAREKGAAKRGGHRVRLSLDDAHLAVDAISDDLLDLNDALGPPGRSRPGQGGPRKAALLRGADAGRGGRCAGHLPCHGRSPLGLRPGMALQGALRPPRFLSAPARPCRFRKKTGMSEASNHPNPHDGARQRTIVALRGAGSHDT